MWTRTQGRPVHRGIAVVVAAALVAALVWVWWPSPGRYRPVQAYERGTLADAFALARPAAGFTTGSQGTGAVYLPPGATPPTRDHPMLAVVLVPHDGGQEPTGTTASVADGGPVSHASDGTWIFPIDQPLAPEAGDNQALSVNTTDGAVTYDTAFALVWADGDSPADNTNEAYALASCDHCAAVAVAFQVVLVTGQADVAVPQNVSVALNYDCTSCLTYALAVQLFVTLDGPLSGDATAALDRLWREIVAFGDDIGQVPLDEIQSRLSDYEEQILAIIEADQGSLGLPSATPSPSDTSSSALPPDPASSSSPSIGESPSGSADVGPSGSPGASTSPADGSTGSSGSSPSPSSNPTTTPSSASASPASPTGSGAPTDATP